MKRSCSGGLVEGGQVNCVQPQQKHAPSAEAYRQDALVLTGMRVDQNPGRRARATKVRPHIRLFSTLLARYLPSSHIRI